MEQAIAQFFIFPQTPNERNSFVELCVNEITSGERDPLELEILLKNLEDTIKEIRKDERVKSCVQKEAAKYPEKIIQLRGYEITKISKPTFYYSNDSKWVSMNKSLKEREQFLKAIKTSVADADTGELIYPPFVKYSDYLTIKYKG
jgi:hypothetical protein